MGIEKKQGPPGKSIPINDLPSDHFPDLPASMVDRFPDAKQWIGTVQERFRVLQKRLSDQARDAAIEKLELERRISELE